MVTINRANASQSYGFTIGSAETGEKVVTNVDPNGIAQGKIKASDVLELINGNNAQKLSHDKMIKIITKTNVLTLSVRRGDEGKFEIPTHHAKTVQYDNVRSPADLMVPMEGQTSGEQVITVYREHKNASFGFQLIRVGDEQLDIVKQIVYGSPADGVVEIGDTILAVNGKQCESLRHDQVIEEICTGLSVTFVVSRVGTSEC